MQLHIFLDYLKEEYRLFEGKVGMPLAMLFPPKPAGADILLFAPQAARSWIWILVNSFVTCYPALG